MLTVIVQLTVAPAATSAITLLIFAYSSDYFVERGFHMTVPLLISIVGYAVLFAVDVEKQIAIGYMAIFFCTIGVSHKDSTVYYRTNQTQAYPMSVIFSAWTMANIPNQNARALTTGFLLAVLNSMGLVASNIFLQREAPKYRTALIVNTAFPCVCVVCTVWYTMYLRRLNRKLDRGMGSHDETDKSGRASKFKFQA
jgi:hypothetical protein